MHRPGFTIPGYALHEKVSQKPKGIDPLVSNRERGTLMAPLINLFQTARVAKVGLNRISFVRASGESSRTVVFDALAGKMDGCLLGTPNCRRSPPCPAPSRSAPPAQPLCAAPPRLALPRRPVPVCPAPPRSVRERPGFGFYKFL